MYLKFPTMLKVLFFTTLTCLVGCLAEGLLGEALLDKVVNEEYTLPPSSPLLLTTYIEQGHTKTAREIAKVRPDFLNVRSYSGYLTVLKNKTCENNMFFWLFTAAKDWHNAPLIVWLQGGPGSSSMYGLFELIGPFNSLSGGLKPRATSWTNFANVLFLDNPVGAGYSYTLGNCFPNSIPEVSEQLYSALKQVYHMFHVLKKNDLFLAGESFAGHYIPDLATLIDSRRKHDEINLKGIVMGNPIIDLACHDYGSYLYQLGMVDATGRDEMYEAQKTMKKQVKEKNYAAAFEQWNHIIDDLIADKTGITDMYSSVTEAVDESTYIALLNTEEVKKLLHVGVQPFIDFNEIAYDHLSGTIAQSFVPQVQKLLKTKKYIVAIYSGNLDIICMYTSAECVMSGLKWHGQQDYLKAPRSTWYLGNQLVGWFKTADNLLLDILVKDAQHAAIYSHPEVTYKMMESIVSAKSGENPLWALQTTTPAEELQDLLP